MKREGRWGMVLMVLAVALGAGAAEKKWTLADWLKDLDAKIRGAQDKHRQSTLAVAAVRGAKTPGTGKLYWKSAKSEVTDAELAAFKSAVDLAQAGKTDESRAALDALLVQYPRTSLKPDVERTRALLAEAPPAVSTPTVPAP